MLGRENLGEQKNKSLFQQRKAELIMLRGVDRIIGRLEKLIKEIENLEQPLELDELDKLKAKLAEEFGENKEVFEALSDLLIAIESGREELKTSNEITRTFLDTLLIHRMSIIEKLKELGLSSEEEINKALEEMFLNLLRGLREYYKIIRDANNKIKERIRPRSTIIRTAKKVLDNLSSSLSSSNLSEEKTKLLKKLRELTDYAERMDDNLRQIHEQFPPTAPSKLLEIIEDRDKRIAEIRQESPEIFVGIALLQLREYVRQLNRGREIIMTPWVERKIYEIIDYLLDGRAVFLYGETGSGKTEVAKLIAEMINPEGYELVRGYRFMGKEELFGYLGLTITEPPKPEEIPELIEMTKKRFRAEHPDLTEEEYEEADRIIEQAIIGQTSNKATITEFLEGPVERAMKEGKILIIDEANYIPPGLIASLNEILANARVGSTYRIPGTNREIRVAKGFGIIMTGNISLEVKRYIERFELDPALRDRVKLIEYNTPSQEYSREIGMTDPGDRDLFLIALAILSDEKGNIILPGGKSGLERVYRLCQGFKLLQEIFAGKDVGPGYEYITESGQKRKPEIVFNNPSMRKFINILKRWKDEGFALPLDYYVFLELIAQAKDTPLEAKYFFYILKGMYGFFEDSEIWGDGYKIPTEDEVRERIVKKYEKPKMLPVDPITLAEAITGEELPSKSIEEKIAKFNIDYHKLSSEYKQAEEELKKLCIPTHLIQVNKST